MKKALAIGILAVLGLNINTLAETVPSIKSANDSGFYVGGSAGLGFTNYEQFEFGFGPMNLGIHKDNHVTSRIFMGYDLNRYLAVELGYTDFWGKSRVKFTYDYCDGGLFAPVFNMKTSGDDCIYQQEWKLKMVQAFDLFGKFKVPVSERVNLYGKLGISFLFSDRLNVDASVLKVIENKQLPVKKDVSVNLAFGAGMDFAITPNVIVNLEWLRFNGNHEIKNYQPDTDALMVGLRYKF